MLSSYKKKQVNPNPSSQSVEAANSNSDTSLQLEGLSNKIESIKQELTKSKLAHIF